MSNKNNPKKRAKKPTGIEDIRGPKMLWDAVEKFLSDLYDIRYNEVSNQIECRRVDDDDFSYELLNENNIFRLLQQHNIGFGMANLLAMLRSDYVKRYNPFVEYFENLSKWDGKDHIKNLCKYISVKNQDRFNNHFKKMLIRTIACAIDTEEYNKHLFLFMGASHKGKTYFLRWLCPPNLKQYFAENISTDKDSMIAICENFIINMDELAGLQKIEIRGLKSILSKDKVKVRLPFDKRPSLAPRRASFVGSTNEMEFLTDVTGSVRWLCFELTHIDQKYSKEIDNAQLWAQAYALYKKGEKFSITADEIAENESTNVQHQVSTMETELIQKYFKPGDHTNGAEFWTASDMVLHLHTIGGNAVRINNQGIGRALTFLQYKQISKRDETDNMPRKGYFAYCQCKPCTEKRDLEKELATALTPSSKQLHPKENKHGEIDLRDK